MCDKKNRARGCNFHVMMTKEEFDRVTEKIKKSGLSKREYTLRCLLDKKIAVIEGGQEMAHQLRRLGANYDQALKNVYLGVGGEKDLKAAREKCAEAVEKICGILKGGEGDAAP